MEVIAYIPELPEASRAEQVVTAASLAAATAAPPCPAPAPTAATTTAAGGARPQETDPADELPRARASAGKHRYATVVLSPSVVVLAVVAAAVWTAAWRNERLRAIEQQRPQRVAMEPTASAGPQRSLTP